MYLFGAANPIPGESSALLAPTVHTEYRNHSLRFINEQVGTDVYVVLVLDRAGWHGAKALEVPSNMTLWYLPPYRPELNPAERPWAYLRRHYLSNRAYRDYDDLLTASGTACNQLTPEHLCSICRTEWLPRTNQS